MRKSLWALVVAALLLGPSAASGLDLGSLDGWDRTADYSSFQHWTFSTGNLPLYPEEVENDFGDEPSGEFTEGVWGWDPAWPCPTAVDPSGTCSGWHCSSEGGGKITLTIPNNEDQNEYKRMFIQMTSTKAPSDVSVSGSGPNTSGYTSGTFPTGRPGAQHPGDAPPTGGTWYTYNFGRTIVPNPKSETIVIEVPQCTVIDQIVVDTECIPEPATLGLLAVGAIALIRRRRS